MADRETGWSATLHVWLKDDRHTGFLRDATHPERGVYVAYDTNHPNPGGNVCNQIATDGTVCRLWRHHEGWDHMPVNPLVLMEAGLYVTEPYDA